MDSPEPSTIVVVGSLNLDSTLFIERLARAGESVEALSFRDGFGGKGANQALAALRTSRQGQGMPEDIEVSMIGAIGKDGVDMRDALALDGIDTSRVLVKDDYNTGRAYITIEHATGESRVILIPGANHSLRHQDFRTSESISGVNGKKPDLLILQLELHRDVVERVLMTAQLEKIPVLLNPAPAKNLLTSSWHSVTHLIANEPEAAALSGKKLEAIQAQGYTSGWKDIADEFYRTHNIRYVVITLGPNGAVYSDAVGRSIHVEAVKVKKVVDATSAGDAFVGAYAASIVRQDPANLNIGEAVHRALKVAAYVVQRAGTQATIPWAGQLLGRRESVYNST